MSSSKQTPGPSSESKITSAKNTLKAPFEKLGAVLLRQKTGPPKVWRALKLLCEDESVKEDGAHPYLAKYHTMTVMEIGSCCYANAAFSSAYAVAQLGNFPGRGMNYKIRTFPSKKNFSH